jgi:hypothetical protein
MNNFPDKQTACRQLIDAADHDMRFRAELEQAGLLTGTYNLQMRAIHEKNAALLATFIADYGWPVPSLYGFKVHEAAWFIAIHAISKPHILRLALQLIEQAMRQGEPVAQEYAKLFDRIALYEGRKQRYGTQFAPSPNGWYAYDLEDPEDVDERRAALGLTTFLEGKKECCADEGGVISPEEQQQDEKQHVAFLKEVGWRK